MCEHKWERIERPWQHLIDKAEGIIFGNSKVWIMCDKCFETKGKTVGSLGRNIPLEFLQAGIGNAICF